MIIEALNNFLIDNKKDSFESFSILLLYQSTKSKITFLVSWLILTILTFTKSPNW